MRDLSSEHQIHLAPSSMAATNTVADPAGHALAMAGPGSVSVVPQPATVDNVIPTGTEAPDAALGAAHRVHGASAYGGPDWRPAGEAGNGWSRAQ
jgi:hypothetical protein